MSLDSRIEELTHDHVFLGKSHDRNARRTLWVVVLTAAMMVVEIAAGILFNSMSLLADGFHMATHAGALGVAALAYAYARRHATNPRYSFGTGKVGDLAGFASAIVLGIVALGIAIESVQRLLAPSPVAFAEATLVAVIGLLVNIASALLLGGGHHHGHAHHHDHHHDHEHDHEHDHDHDDDSEDYDDEAEEDEHAAMERLEAAERALLGRATAAVAAANAAAAPPPPDEAVVTVMEFTGMGRAAALDLLARHGGSPEAAVQSLYS